MPLLVCMAAGLAAVRHHTAAAAAPTSHRAPVAAATTACSGVGPFIRQPPHGGTRGPLASSLRLATSQSQVSHSVHSQQHSANTVSNAPTAASNDSSQ